MSIQAVAWALEQDIRNAPLKLLLVVLCNHADKESGELFLRHSTAEREASMSRSSVQRHMKTLAEMGIVEVGVQFEASGRQAANSYRIVFDPTEQMKVAEARRRAEGCQSDTLPPCGKTCAELGKNDPFEGVNLTPRGVSVEQGEGVTADTPNTNHPSKPLPPLPPDSTTFDALCTAWTAEHAAENRPQGFRAFMKLSEAEKAQAVKMAPVYCRREAWRRNKPDIGRYLRDRAFVALDGAPDFDRDGDFIITPDREEWAEWIVAIRAAHGEAGVASVRRLGKIVRPTRWPPTAARQYSMAVG